VKRSSALICRATPYQGLDRVIDVRLRPEHGEAGEVLGHIDISAVAARAQGPDKVHRLSCPVYYCTVLREISSSIVGDKLRSQRQAPGLYVPRRLLSAPKAPLLLQTPPE
jgi:hypothetical protein